MAEQDHNASSFNHIFEGAVSTFKELVHMGIEAVSPHHNDNAVDQNNENVPAKESVILLKGRPALEVLKDNSFELPVDPKFSTAMSKNSAKLSSVIASVGFITVKV